MHLKKQSFHMREIVFSTMHTKCKLHLTIALPQSLREKKEEGKKREPSYWDSEWEVTDAAVVVDDDDDLAYCILFLASSLLIL